MRLASQKNDRKGNFIHIYIFYIYVSNMYMLNSTIIQRREPKFINLLELIKLVLGDRMNLWLDFIRLIL